MPELNLADLPAELKLDILSYLPAKEIQKARQVSSHFKQLIDNPENSGILTKRTATPSQVGDVHNNILNFDPVQDDLLCLLSRVVRLNGEWHPRLGKIVQTIWFRRLGIDPNDTQWVTVRELLFRLGSMHDLNHQASRYHDRMRFSNDKCKKNLHRDLSRDWRLGNLQACNLDLQNVLGYFDRVVRCGELKTKSAKEENKFVLYDVHDYILHLELCWLLNVPEIPQWAKKVIFCYAVRTRGARRKIFAVLHGRTKFTDLEYAAVREEIFLTLDLDRF